MFPPINCAVPLDSISSLREIYDIHRLGYIVELRSKNIASNKLKLSTQWVGLYY